VTPWPDAVRTWEARPASVVEALGTIVLPASFIATDVAIIVYGHYRLGFDAMLFSLAAQALLAGGDPWLASLDAVEIAAPPSSIVPYAATAWLPVEVAAIFWVGSGLAAAIWAIERLALERYWLLFPPLFVSVWTGSLDAFLPATFLAAPALAPFLKPYAVAGIIAERRWRALLVSGLLILPTLPLVPLWLAHDPGAVLADQSRNLSAWGNPILLALTIPALISLGWRRGWFYAVPALWPWAQLHYATMALPAVRPIAGFALCTPVGVIAEAVVDRVRRVRR